MNNMKTTKRALLSSVLALMLCFAMLLGTTFAWFTDTAVSANNKIVAGELDVELYQWTSETQTEGTNISESQTPVFTGDILWEPGMTQVRYLSIKNNGNLALKYKVVLEVTSVSEDSLLDVMTYAITPDAKYGDVGAWAGNGTTVVSGVNATQAIDVELAPGDEHFFALSVHMDEEAGNQYMKESVTFDIKVLAGQLAYEEDSFGPEYDKDSTYFVVSDPIDITSDVTNNFIVESKGGNNSVAVALTADLLNSISDEVTSIGLSHSEPVVDEVNNTVTYDTIEFVDQNGNAIDMSANTIPMTVTLPAQKSFPEGDSVAIFHDGKLIAVGFVNADTTITYEANHFCEVKVATIDEKYVSAIGTNFYETVNDAIKKLGAGETITLLRDINTTADDVVIVDKDVVINGNGNTVYRTEETAANALFTVKSGATLTLSNVTVDGGAVWTGDVNTVLLRGIENTGITAGGALVSTEANAHLVLGEGAILQNNDGANAVNLGTRVGATLTLNGGEIINNHSAAGAIWGGGAITINDGKVNGNHGGIGGAIRAVTNIGTLLTMNGGEMNHNYSDDNGGAIWAGTSRSNNVYVLNGGEMAYNYSATTGGAIYAGYCETVKIGGTFKMHDNSCASDDIGSAIRFHNSASLIMTGGEIYNHDENAFFLNNNSASITGGKYVGNFGYSGGVGLTLGEAEIDGVINYNLSTNHNTAYLAAEFGSFEFSVNESASNFAQFNFKPAADYTYTEGDEAKLVCVNEGYETYWDAATSTFRLKTAE